MSGRFDDSEPYDEEWGAVDPEGPQECDLIDEDEDETPTVPCPRCRREIPDFADQCPYCGDWVVQGAGAPTRRKPWFWLTVILVLAAFVLWYVL